MTTTQIPGYVVGTWDIDIHWVEEHDPWVNELGIKGIGEIGITGAAAAVANAYFVAAINRVGVEEYGDNDFYGTSYFADPRGQLVGEAASGHDEELVVRDLDLDLVDEVRRQWAFYRDRRPDAYGPLVQG